jgi:hypothetical protein
MKSSNEWLFCPLRGIMKLFVGLLSLIFSISSFACPVLDGEFICKSSKKNSRVSVKSKVKNGSTVYEFVQDGRPFRRTADGVWRPYIDENFKNLKDIKFRTFCDGQDIVMNLSADNSKTPGWHDRQETWRFENSEIVRNASVASSDKPAQLSKIVCKAVVQ